MTNTKTIESDIRFMREALKEAEIAKSKNEIPIGCVVVNKNRIIGRGHNSTESLNDPTGHAEMIAITSACQYLSSKILDDCTLYVTAEPCCMCASASKLARIKRIVYGVSEPKTGFSQYNSNILHPKTEVTNGILEEECKKILVDFFDAKR